MKITHTIRTLFLTTVSAFILTSCLEDEPAVVPSPASVTFSTPTLGISELAGPTDIILSLGKPAIKAGTVTLKIETDHADDFTTSPASIDGKIEMPVASGQSQVKFTLTPVHNSLHHGNKQIGITIDAVTDGMIIGTEKVLAVTILEIDQPNLVNFVATHGSLIENAEEGFFLSIGLSLMAMGQGVVEVEITNSGELYDTYFTTEPAAVGGKITLTVEPGTTYLPIKFIPVNNATLNGHKEIGLTLVTATGAIAKGNQVSFTLSLKDDELMDKPKSYETSAGTWKDKRVYEYNEAGQIARVIWEQNALSGTDTYHYDETGNLKKISNSTNAETRFQHDSQGRIILSEKFGSGVLKKYTIYTYDEAGNIGEAAIFDRQPSGEYVMSSLFVYLYYSNTNHLFKRLTYYPVEGTEDFDLIQEETYEYYVQYYPANPFPMVEILPGINVQPFYPSKYILSRDGQEYNYPLTYVFNNQGLPERRTTSNGEVTTYQYY